MFGITTLRFKTNNIKVHHWTRSCRHSTHNLLRWGPSSLLSSHVSIDFPSDRFPRRLFTKFCTYFLLPPSGLLQPPISDYPE